MPRNLFGITRTVGNGNVTTQSVFGWGIIVSSHFRAVYFWGSLWMVLWRRRLLATAKSIERASLMVTTNNSYPNVRI
jgi:hypothetical protein